MSGCNRISRPASMRRSPTTSPLLLPPPTPSLPPLSEPLLLDSVPAPLLLPPLTSSLPPLAEPLVLSSIPPHKRLEPALRKDLQPLQKPEKCTHHEAQKDDDHTDLVLGVEIDGAASPRDNRVKHGSTLRLVGLPRVTTRED